MKRVLSIFGLIGMLLLGFSCTTSEGNINGSSVGTGQVWIGLRNSTENGRIFIDHKITDKTTPDTFNLVAGEHVVHVFVPNYRTIPESLVVTVPEGKLIDLDFSIEETQSGTLEVRSTPDSAAVVIDGLYFGATPLQVPGIAAGAHQLQVEKLLFNTRIEDVVVGYNQTASKTIQMQEKIPHKIVLLEHFSNASCPPCPTADDTIQQVLDDLSQLQIEVISWHVKFPSPNDPFYVSEKENNDGRAQQYNVTFTPTVFVDSRRVSFNSFSQLGSRLRDSLIAHSRQEPAYANMDVRIEQAGETISGKIAVKALTDLPAETILRVVCIQLHREFSQPPGTNGQTEFSHVLSAVWPDINGTPLSLSSDEIEEVAFHIPRKNDWDGQLKLIAFLQKGAAGEILQLIGSKKFN